MIHRRSPPSSMRGVAPYHEAAFQTRHLAQKASPQGKLVRRLRSWIIKPIGFFVALLVALFSLIRYGRVMARLTGTVTDATGASVHEAEVSTSSATAPGRTDSTDFDGAYSLRVRRNTSYRLTVRFQNHLWYDEQIDLNDADEFREDITLPDQPLDDATPTTTTTTSTTSTTTTATTSTSSTTSTSTDSTTLTTRTMPPQQNTFDQLTALVQDAAFNIDPKIVEAEAREFR